MGEIIPTFRMAGACSGLGLITLSDGTTLKLKIFVVDIKEIGFSPFGGINFDVKAVGGVSTHTVPEDLKKAVADKAVALSEPYEGWEILDVTKQEPPTVEEVVETSKGKYKVRVVADTVMAARNMKYKTLSGELIYHVSWVWKVSWKPVEGGK